MMDKPSLGGERAVSGRARAGALVASAAALLAAVPASAVAANTTPLIPNTLVVSGSTYAGNSGSVAIGETLPIGCQATTNFGGVSCATAAYNGAYPTVFNNAPIDASFGITSPVWLEDLTPGGFPLRRINIPTSEMTTSFSSKSELGLNFSTGGQDLTFMGYVAPVNAIDVSNSNTPGVIDPSNPDPQAYYRQVADLSATGSLNFTLTNAYSGNNGRAAILDSDNGQIYTSGNAGNGNTPQPDGVILGAGAQIIAPGESPFTAPTPVGSFNQTQIPGTKADKVGKDTNFRGLTIYNNVVYFTKGSGGNGIDTVYFIDTTGTACPTTGTGVPVAGASLPTAINYVAADLQTSGVTPYNMCVLQGFNTISQKSKTPPPPPFDPFGIWFANATTLYVADEGDGAPVYDSTSNTYTDATPANNIGGLEKWTFDGTQWNLDYTIQNGLNLGTPYTVLGYPTGDNAATGLPWAPATDGLRNITGRVNKNGTATVYAVTSTVSGSGDQGADPNQVVAVNDELASTSAGSESFRTIVRPRDRQVVRGVALVPPNFGAGS
jgi:hypothetical protein